MKWRLVFIPILLIVTLTTSLRALSQEYEDKLGVCPVLGRNASDSSIAAFKDKANAAMPMMSAHVTLTPRQAAQKGLDYLIPTGINWSNGQNCNGCHVQAFAIVGGSIGIENGFTVDVPTVRSTALGMINPCDGQLPNGCFGRCRNDLYNTITQFAVWSLAAYDHLVNQEFFPNLQNAVDCLAGRRSGGCLYMDHNEPPVDQSTTMATANFMAGAKRCYEVTGDTKYQTWLQDGVNCLRSSNPSTTQDIVFVILGLKLAGASDSDSKIQEMVALLRSGQNSDGGWGYSSTWGSYPYGTGEALYGLKSAGISTTDPAIQNGITYLLNTQSIDGSWPELNWPAARPSTFASTMWAVLGLVDLTPPMTVEIISPLDGVRVPLGETVNINVSATPNNGVPVDHIDLYIDGQKVVTQNGSSLTYDWSTVGLTDERFYPINAVAFNTDGQSSHDENRIILGNLVVVSFTANPNPFDPQPPANQVTTLQYELLFSGNQPGLVDVKILDQQNSVVRTLLNQAPQQSGLNSVAWNGSQDAGGTAPYGHYLARIDALDVNSNTQGNLTEQVIAAMNPAQAATIAGKITELDGVTPIKDALVKVLTESGELHGSAITTEQGAYQISTLSTGTTYVLQVSKQSYLSHKSLTFTALAGQPTSMDMILFRFLTVGEISLKSESITDLSSNKYLLEGNVVIGNKVGQVFSFSLGIASKVEVDVSGAGAEVKKTDVITLRALDTEFPIEVVSALSVDPANGRIMISGTLHCAAGAIIDIPLPGTLILDLNNHILTGRATIDNEYFSSLGEVNLSWGYGTCSFLGFDYKGKLEIGPITAFDAVAILGVEMKSGVFKIGGDLGLFKVDFAGLGYQVSSEDIDLELKVKGQTIGVSGVIALNLTTMGVTVERDLAASVSIPIPKENTNSGPDTSQTNQKPMIPIIVDLGFTLYGQEHFDDLNCNGIYDPGIDRFVPHDPNYDSDDDGIWDEGTNIRLRDGSGNWDPYFYGKASIDLGLYYVINFQVAQAECRIDFRQGKFFFSGAVGAKMGDLFDLRVVEGTLDLDALNRVYKASASFRPVTPGVSLEFAASFTADMKVPSLAGTFGEGITLFNFVDLATSNQSFALDKTGLNTTADLTILNTLSANAGFKLTGQGIEDGVFRTDFNIHGFSLLGTNSTFQVKNECLSGEGDVQLGSCITVRGSFKLCKDQFPEITFPGMSFCMLSPVDMHLYDSANRHTGKLADGTVETAIPGSMYQECAPCDRTFIYVSNPDLLSGYKLALDGVGQGTANLSLVVPDANSGVVISSDFANRPVSPSYSCYIDVVTGGSMFLHVDSDGDGQYEEISQPDSSQSLAYSGQSSPYIKAVQVHEVPPSSVVIDWETDVPTSRGFVLYGLSSVETDTSMVDSVISTNHEVILPSIQTGRLYYYRVVAHDSTGLQIKSVDLTFKIPLSCGDVDGDGSVTIADVVFLINYIFLGGAAPQPLSLGDVDCSGRINIADAVRLINYVFAGGPEPCAACK